MTTNKNEKKEKKEKEDPAGSDERRLAGLFLDLILKSKPDFRRPDLDRWASVIGRMIRRDERSPERIETVIRAARRDPFWQNIILGPADLRKHFDRLEMNLRSNTPTESLDERILRLQQEGGRTGAPRET